MFCVGGRAHIMREIQEYTQMVKAGKVICLSGVGTKESVAFNVYDAKYNLLCAVYKDKEDMRYGIIFGGEHQYSNILFIGDSDIEQKILKNLFNLCEENNQKKEIVAKEWAIKYVIHILVNCLRQFLQKRKENQR